MCYVPKIRARKFILLHGFNRGELTFSPLTCSRKFSRGCEDRSEPSPSRRSASETEFGGGFCALSRDLCARVKFVWAGVNSSLAVGFSYFRLLGFYCREQ